MPRDMNRPAFIPEPLWAQLCLNGTRTAIGHNIDPPPVLKLFTPDAQATWLLSEAYLSTPDLAFGLCDPGLGYPELGYVSLAELACIRGPLGLRIELDTSFVAIGPLSTYATAARAARRVVTPPQPTS